MRPSLPDRPAEWLQLPGQVPHEARLLSLFRWPASLKFYKFVNLAFTSLEFFVVCQLTLLQLRWQQNIRRLKPVKIIQMHLSALGLMNIIIKIVIFAIGLIKKVLRSCLCTIDE